MPDLARRRAARAAGGIRHPSSPRVARRVAEHCFWLDAGPDARDGLELGRDRACVEPDPERVRARVARDASGRRMSGRRAASAAAGSGGSGTSDGRGPRRRAGRASRTPRCPPERWLRVERFVAFDHARTAGLGGRARRERRACVRGEVAPRPRRRRPRPTAGAGGSAVARHEPAAYAALIERCRDAIREGDAYQLCLTTRFAVDAGRRSGRRLRAPARARPPRTTAGSSDRGDVALASASPERFLEVDGRHRPHPPDQGHAPARRAMPQTDAALAAELRASEKERAENVMIVDLMRNDLSRVCEPGSVGVDGLLEVESYAGGASARQHRVGHARARARPSATCSTRPSRPAA